MPVRFSLRERPRSRFLFSAHGHVLDERVQKGGIAGQFAKRAERGCGVFGGDAARSFDAVKFHERRLVGLRVLTGGLAERRGVGGGVEDVVDDLERQAEVAARAAEGGEVARVRAADETAQHEGGRDHRGGFVEMNELQLVGGRVGFFLREEVFHLAADQAAAAGGIGEFADERVGEDGVHSVALGEETEGVGEERVAGEEGGGFVELLVRRGPAAAQVVVIHARKVVVDERVGVDALDGDGGGQGVGRSVAEQLGGGEDEDGAEAFAAGFEAVAHRGVESRRARRGGREVEVEAAFDGGDVVFEFGGEVHGACRGRGVTGRK